MFVRPNIMIVAFCTAFALGTIGIVARAEQLAAQPQYEAAEWTSVLSARRLIESQVMDKDGHYVAEVVDVVFDVEVQRVFVILAVSGDSRYGEKQIAVPYHRFAFAGPSVAFLPATRTQILAEPAFDYSTPPSATLIGG